MFLYREQLFFIKTFLIFIPFKVMKNSFFALSEDSGVPIDLRFTQRLNVLFFYCEGTLTLSSVFVVSLPQSVALLWQSGAQTPSVQSRFSLPARPPLTPPWPPGLVWPSSACRDQHWGTGAACPSRADTSQTQCTNIKPVVTFRASSHLIFTFILITVYIGTKQPKSPTFSLMCISVKYTLLT